MRGGERGVARRQRTVFSVSDCSVLNQLMPRFYSLSNDPHVSSAREGLAGRRLIEMSVTIHETPAFAGSMRTGVGSGFLERVAKKHKLAGYERVKNVALMVDPFTIENNLLTPT